MSLAPYDARQGSFTGAGTNGVTKSDTNAVKGTVYTCFRNESLVGKKVEGATIDNPSLKFNQTGFVPGGPIVKNKLFFFVNREATRQTDPGQTFRPATSAAEATAAQSGQLSGISRVLRSSLDLNALAVSGGKAPIKQVDVTVAQFGIYVRDEYQATLAAGVPKWAYATSSTSLRFG